MQFTLRTTKREEMIDITKQIQTMISRYSVKDGLVNIFIPHTTAAITINENCDENVKEDLLDYLKKQVPQNSWKHDKVDGNGDAHIKTSIMTPNITIPIQHNRLLLGKWQGILFCEFNGPKDRTIFVNVFSSFS